MAYKLHYSDYSTTSGPPDPAAWVGPPGPQGVPGPVGPQGIPGPGGVPEAPADGPIFGRGGSTLAWTPTLPTAGGAMTGALSLFGNATSALHAVPLQQLTAATAGGPFLPLATGGTVSGPTTFNVQTKASSFYAGMGNTMTFAGAQPIEQYGFLYVGNLAGNAASGAAVNYITIPTDNVSMPANSQGLSWLAIAGNFGGAAMSGSRAGLNVGVNYVGPNVSANDGQRQWQATFNQFNAGASAGGTAPHLGSSAGYGYGSGDLALLLAGATNWSGIIGHEIDVGIATGASAAARQGLLIVSYSNLQGTDYDQGIVIAAASGAPGWVQAFSLAQGALDPINGVVLGYQPGAPANPTAKSGIDLSAFTFSGKAFNSTGFSVSGSGHVAVGNGLDFGAAAAVLSSDTSLHLTLNTFGYGIGVTPNRINYVVPAGNNAHVFVVGTADQASINAGALNFLNATANIVNFGAVGIGPPAFTTRSVGAKVVLFNQLSSSTADFAVGIEPGAAWFGVPTTGSGFKWYGGTTVAATLAGTGALTLASGFGLFSATAVTAKPTVSGAKGSNAALASLLSALASYGLITDSTTA